jgi:hypothetical protein
LRSRSGRIAAGSAWTSVIPAPPARREAAPRSQARARASSSVVRRDDPAADARLELARRAQGDDPARVDERDPVGHLGLLHVVGREEHRPPGVGQRRAPGPRSPARVDVEAERGLVEEEDARVGHERSGELELAALAPGQLLREPVRRVRDAELRQDLGRPLAGPGEREAVEEAHQA